MVHLGLGAFHRAHQAWYTDAANAAADPFGIAGFTGRRPDAAVALNKQDGLYTLVVRGRENDAAQICSSIAYAHDGADVDALGRYLRDPGVTVATLTITEAGYHRASDGGLDRADSLVRADIAALRSGGRRLVTAPARLLCALASRRAADVGGLAVVSCDNLPGNGAGVRQVLLDLADDVNAGLRIWIEEEMCFVSTVVDRITPATTDADRHTAQQLTGFCDAAPVVTEPYTEWVLTDNFIVPRPQWESAGARFVRDVEPFELRKLWLLNGAHSLLAYAGQLRGHQTVAAAMTDGACRGWVEQWWDEACAHLPLPKRELATYRRRLVDRFGQPRIAHRLAQIAMDGAQKLPVRVAPVLRAERAAGRTPVGGARIVAAWLVHVGSVGAEGSGAPELAPLAAEPRSAAAAALRILGPDLAEDPVLVDLVADLAGELRGRADRP